MEGHFIPFFPQTANTGSFTPSTAKGTELASAPPSVRLVNPKATAEAIRLSDASPQPVVTLQREADRVTRIRIQCACGEVIDLDCLY